MRAVHVHGPGDLRVDDIAEPAPGDADVLVKVAACGICGTDLTYARIGMRRPNGDALPLGHEIAGTVLRAGSAVRDIHPGMRVVINPMGDPANVVGNGGSEGGFADLLLVRAASLGRNLLEVPPGLTLERAALAEPLAVALHGVNRADPEPGSKVVVFGAGPIGLGAVIWLQRRGVRSIVSVDRSAARLDHARRFGATDIIDADREDVWARLRDIHGAGPDVLTWPTIGTDIFIDMAGAPEVIAGVVAAAKFHARLVIVAVHPKPVPVDFQTALLKEIGIVMSVGYPTELPEALATLADIGDDIAPFVSHSFGFDQFPTAFETARSPASAKVMVTF